LFLARPLRAILLLLSLFLPFSTAKAEVPEALAVIKQLKPQLDKYPIREMKSYARYFSDEELRKARVFGREETEASLSLRVRGSTLRNLTPQGIEQLSKLGHGLIDPNLFLGIRPRNLLLELPLMSEIRQAAILKYSVEYGYKFDPAISQAILLTFFMLQIKSPQEVQNQISEAFGKLDTGAISLGPEIENEASSEERPFLKKSSAPRNPLLVFCGYLLGRSRVSLDESVPQ